MQKEEKKYPETIVSALILNKKDEVLLARSKKWDKYTIPGGHVRFGEKLEDAIKREVKEETGLEVKIEDELNFSEDIFPKEYDKEKHLIYHRFICRYSGELDKVKMKEEFEKDYKWVSPDEALKLDLLKSITDLINYYKKFKEAQKYLDSWKRCQADFENYKKDQAKHQEEFAKFAKMDVIEQILPVLDNFEASLSHIPEKEKNSAWVTGITHIKRQIEDVLKNNNVEEIVVKIGDKFNPEIHEAVAGKGEKVKKVLQKGYKLNGRIMRVAKVEVE